MPRAIITTYSLMLRMEKEKKKKNGKNDLTHGFRKKCMK